MVLIIEWLQVYSGLVIRYLQVKYFKIVKSKEGVYSLRVYLIDGEEVELMVGTYYVLEVYLKLLLVELSKFKGSVFHLDKFNEIVKPKLGSGRGLFCV